MASWILVATIVLGMAAFVSFAQYFSPKSVEASAAELLMLEITAKTVVGFPNGPEEDALKQIEVWSEGPIEQRLGHAILVNEIAGADRALQQLEEIDRAVSAEKKVRAESDNTSPFPTESQNDLLRIVESLLKQYQQGDFDSSDIPDADQQRLEQKLGWVANLALYPESTPNSAKRRQIESAGWRIVVLMALGGLGALALTVSGFISFYLLSVMVFAKTYQVHFEHRSPFGFVYIETFAIWMVLFIAMQFLASTAALALPNDWKFAMTPLAFFGSLLALAWPMIRGVPLVQLRRDIGWQMKNPFVETFFGVSCYLAMVVPLLALVAAHFFAGVVFSATATSSFESSGPTGHPIAGEIAAGGPLVWLSVFVSACIAAPIVEETMFRGVLYRYLRDATGKPNRARWVSVVASSMFGGLIFAAIHPQGLAGIPVLMTLAFGFSLAREWRNSLIAPMVMHAINNTIVTTMLVLVVM